MNLNTKAPVFPSFFPAFLYLCKGRLRQPASMIDNNKLFSIMTRFTFIALAFGCLSLTASAQSAGHAALTNRQQVMDAFNAKTRQAATMHKLLRVNPYTSDIISEKPEGLEMANLNRQSKSFFNFDNSLFDGMDVYENKYEVGSYIEGDDGCYYIHDPFGIMPTDSYLKLEEGEGDTLVAHTPQAILSLNGTYYATRLVARKGDDGAMGYFLDPQAEEGRGLDVKYVIDNDGTLRQVSDGYVDGYPSMPQSVLALTDGNGNLFCYADADMVMSPMNDVATTLPAGAEVKDFVMRYTQRDNAPTYKNVKVALTSDALYLRNPYDKDSMMWIRGDIGDGKVTFLRQYIGVDTTSTDAFYPHHSFFVPYDYVYNGLDPNTFDPLYDYTLKDKLVFDYDPQNFKLTLRDGQGFMFNLNPDSSAYLASYDNPSIFEFHEVPATPADPVITFYGPYSDQSACGVVTASIATVDTDGNYIQPSKLFYNVYFDDSTEPFVFTTSDYMNLTEDMTDVPYGFDDGYDFMFKGSSNTFYFYQPAEKNVGVQTVYKGGGEVHRSNIVWMTNEAAAVDRTVVDGECVSEEYFDLQGRRVVAPTRGLYLRKQVFANRKTVVKKILR